MYDGICTDFSNRTSLFCRMFAALVLVAVIGQAASNDDSSFTELARYTRQVEIIQDKLIAENCADPRNMDVRVKRNVIGGSLEYHIRLEVQKELYEDLVKILIDCRASQTSTASQSSTTSKPATTTTPQTRAPPTTSTKTTVPPTTLPSIPEECRLAINLNETWRQDHKGSNIKPITKGHFYNCDTVVMVNGGRPWFRFVGAAGNKLMDKPVPKYSCGTEFPFYSLDPMPTRVGRAMHMSVYVAGDRSGHQSRAMNVIKCSTRENDFVYRYISNTLPQSIRCNYGFCGMTA